MKIVQLSDMHLLRLADASPRDAEGFVAFVDALTPDLVVHVGGAGVTDAGGIEARAEGVRRLSRLAAPLGAIPGDRGFRGPGENLFGDEPATAAGVRAFRDVFGHDRFLCEAGEWAAVGIDSGLLDSGLPEEAEQWEWIEGLPARVEGRPVVLFTHRPIWALRPELRGARPASSVDAGSLPRLRSVLERMDVRVFGGGQLHHYGLLWRDGVPLAAALSAASVHRTVTTADIAGLGAQSLSMVAYRLGATTAMPRFRSLSRTGSGEPCGAGSARAA